MKDNDTEVLNCPNCGMVKASEVIKSEMVEVDLKERKEQLVKSTVCIKCRSEFDVIIESVKR